MNEVRKVTVELVKLPYHNPAKSAFCILKGIVRGVDEHGKPDGIGKPITAKGNLHNPIIGAYYILTGTAEWEADFNEHQFKFTSYEVSQTATATGTQNYLAKECPAIGEGRARQLVELFGEKTMEMLANADNIRFVSEQLPGLDIKQATEIYEWCKKESVLMPVKQKLYEAGMTQGLIKTLVSNYGTATEKVLREQAFTLTDIKGIGFLTADKIAKKFGMSETNPQRIREGVLYALVEEMDSKGHTCIEHHTLINAACGLLGVHKSHVIEVMKSMIETEELCTNRTDPKKISKIPELFEEDQPLPPPSQLPNQSAASTQSSIQAQTDCSTISKPQPVHMEYQQKMQQERSLNSTESPLPTSQAPATPAMVKDSPASSSSVPVQPAMAVDSKIIPETPLPESSSQPITLLPPAQPSRRNARRFSA